MELTPELVTAAVIGVFLFFAGLGNYYRTLKGGTNHAMPAQATATRDQIDDLVMATDHAAKALAGIEAQTRRIADALTDKNTEGIQDRLDDLAGRLDKLGTSRRRARRPRAGG